MPLTVFNCYKLHFLPSIRKFRKFCHILYFLFLYIFMREVHKIWNLQIFPHKILEHFSKISMSIVYNASPTLLLMHT